MKNIYEVLRQKEQQSEQLQKEIDALRLTITILDTPENAAVIQKSDSRSNGNGNSNETATASSGSPAKRFP
ncbi:MAG: hypothetical protein ACXVZX_11685 [Terriglobales bacterium]